MKKYYLALDLKDDPKLIEAYKKHHENVSTEIRESIIKSGITKMEIFCVENRLFMVLETQDWFSFEEKSISDKLNPKVQEWETLMNAYQKPIKNNKNKEKWTLLEKIFELKK